MNIRWLLHRNIRYFARYYRLVAMAVVITVAVIVGSLVVGDSVRMTLVRRVTERLGNTETIIFPGVLLFPIRFCLFLYWESPLGVFC